MRQLLIDNYLIDKPILDILYDLQQVLTNGKLKDIKPGSDYIMISCPSHSNGLEKNPDCGIYIGDDTKKDYGFAHCFACDFKGSFDKFVAECFNSSLEFAKQWLISKYGVKVKEKIVIGDNINLNKSIIKQHKDIHCLDKYQSYCPYLQKRKVSREVCEQFKVKYDPIKRQVLFPSFDEKGNLITITKRNIDYKKFELEKDVEKVVYGLDQIIKNNIKSAIICEGQFDVLTAWSFGYPAISTLGGISLDQIDKINKSCITHLILAMDNDAAGKKFTEILKNKLDKRILISELNIPRPAKDINDLDKETFIMLLQNIKK